MPSEDIVITARNLTKTYRLFAHPGDRIKQFMSLGLRRYHREFTALRDVSFEIKRGETVGIVGRNGAGKSTLLQLVCGILKPTAGTVEVRGRISALLELGAGFNPEFTGRENVYFQGALMGLSKAHMDARFDEIAAFADIGEFIDQPVRTYSSGMFVRLAFAVAVHVQPDILVIDEALAVGDAAFQARCLERLHGLQKRGAGILLVTHSSELLAHLCHRALLLDSGRLLAADETARVLERYAALTGAGGTAHGVTPARQDRHVEADAVMAHPAYNPAERRWGEGCASIHTITLIQEDRHDPAAFFAGGQIEVRFGIRFHASVCRPIYGLAVKNDRGGFVLHTNSRQLLQPRQVPAQSAGDEAWIVFEFLAPTEEGDYLLSVGIAEETATGVRPCDRRYDVLRLRIVQPPATYVGAALRPACRILTGRES